MGGRVCVVVRAPDVRLLLASQHRVPLLDVVASVTGLRERSVWLPLVRCLLELARLAARPGLRVSLPFASLGVFKRLHQLILTLI